jgi:hypothetical protein
LPAIVRWSIKKPPALQAAANDDANPQLQKAAADALTTVQPGA